jgi:hypothetical protein
MAFAKNKTTTTYFEMARRHHDLEIYQKYHWNRLVAASTMGYTASPYDTGKVPVQNSSG